MGAALVGLVWALGTAIKRRGEASAAKDEAEAATETASARAVNELIVQLGDVRNALAAVKLEARADLERAYVRIERLEGRVMELVDEVETEKSAREHYQSQTNILQGQLVEKTAHNERLLAELKRLYGEISGGFHGLPIKPPKLD